MQFSLVFFTCVILFFIAIRIHFNFAFAKLINEMEHKNK